MNPKELTSQKLLLACGVAYALAYAIANDVVAATVHGGYSRLSQAVSELSATGAPTKGFLSAMLPVFTGLLVAFGIGVWRSADGNRPLAATGLVLVAHGLSAPLWLLGPMSEREVIAAAGGTSSDVLHIVMTIATVLLILSQLGFGAAALGRRFLLYSVATAVTVVVSGVLTGVQSASMVAGKVTPFLGLTERIGIAAWLFWLVVLALALMRKSSVVTLPAPIRPREPRAAIRAV